MVGLYVPPQVKLRKVEADGVVGPVLSTACGTLKREELGGQGASSTGAVTRSLDLDTVDSMGCVTGTLRVRVSVVSLLPVSLEEALARGSR